MAPNYFHVTGSRYNCSPGLPGLEVSYDRPAIFTGADASPGKRITLNEITMQTSSG